MGNPWIWNNGKPLYLLEWLQLPRLSPASLLFQFDGQLGQCFLKLFSCFETFLKQIETNYNILKCVSLFFISSLFGLHFVIENLIFKGSAHNRSMRLLNSSVAINIEQPVHLSQNLRLKCTSSRNMNNEHLRILVGSEIISYIS